MNFLKWKHFYDILSTYKKDFLTNLDFPVVASEDGKESTAPLEVTIADVNDNAPVFSRPLYTAQVKEDIEIGVPILKGNF